MNKKSTMTDLARKILLTGVGAVFMTQEGIRKSLSDLELPKDAVNNLTDSLRRQKNEMMNVLAGEISGFLSKIRLHEELQKVLKGLEIQLNAKVSFDQKKQAAAKLQVHRK